MTVPLRLNSPYWLEGADTSFPTLSSDLEVDVAVIGAGITGCSAAYLLKQAGQSVALLETNRIGYGATGYTTAKLTVGHGLVYADLIKSHGVEAATLYARSNHEALEQIALIVKAESIECDFERAANYVYVESQRFARDIEREVEAACVAGVDASLTTQTDLPYPVAAAIKVDDQAQIHPWKYVAALAKIVAGDGSHVFELTRATNVSSGSPCVVDTSAGRIRADHVIVATQLPFLDRGLFFAKAHPTKSYAVAALVDGGSAPRGMYISADQPTRSVRSAPGAGADGQRILILGGEGHRMSEASDPRRRYERLEEFLADRFATSATHWWSTHDYSPVDKLPYIGRLRRSDERILVATGFAKWGMTKGTLAGAMLRDAVLGRDNPYADLYDAKRVDLGQSVRELTRQNGKILGLLVRDRLRHRPGAHQIERLAPGDGLIARIGGKHYAVSRGDDEKVVVLSARCTHLGCIVGWNAADRAWECPCHGSRFAADGVVVQGPATRDLRRENL
jgi:glycine/D-amino acid oxidase-like deaminating enzyme/nitrite reductase/ring-hydroxylating ferredoxin subunit